MNEPGGPPVSERYPEITGDSLGLGELASSILSQQVHGQDVRNVLSKYPSPPSTMLPPAPGTPARSVALLQSDKLKQAAGPSQRERKGCEDECEDDEEGEISPAPRHELEQKAHAAAVSNGRAQPAQRKPYDASEASEIQQEETPQTDRIEWPKSRLSPFPANLQALFS